MKFILLDPKSFLDDQHKIEHYLSWPWGLLVASFAIGFLTLTIVEGIKHIKKFAFLRREVKWWLIGQDNRDDFKESVLSDLFLLATGGDKYALFSLPIDNLCGQISTAVQSALESPSVYSKLIFTFLGESSKKTLVADDFELLTSMETKNLPGRMSETELEYFLEARNRLSTVIQRNIDALQINLTYQWKRRMRSYSLITSIFISIMGSLLFGNGVNFITIIIVIIFLGYVGAFFASLISDLIGLVKRRSDAL